MAAGETRFSLLCLLTLRRMPVYLLAVPTKLRSPYGKRLLVV